MLNINIAELKIDLSVGNSMPYEISIPMEVNERNVKFFKKNTTYISGKKIVNTLIFWSYDYQKITYNDCYDYIKSNITGFTEYIDKDQTKYLINDSLCAGAEKYDWGIYLRFINGDGLSLAL